MYELKEITWNCDEAVREDLKLANVAWQMGFEIRTERPFNSEYHPVPADALRFRKNGVHIWYTPWLDKLWRAADLIDNYFENHRSYPTLLAALEAERGNL